MLKRNIVTCLLWVGTSKPPMSLFLQHFKPMIYSASISVQTPNGHKFFTLKPLFGVFDLVAKAPVLNMNQFNGKYGCPSCLHPGVRVDGVQTYPPGIDYKLRTNDSMIMRGAEAERRQSVIKGIKDPSILEAFVDLALGAQTDYMHCVLEGVVKRMLDKGLHLLDTSTRRQLSK